MANYRFEFHFRIVPSWDVRGNERHFAKGPNRNSVNSLEILDGETDGIQTFLINLALFIPHGV